VVHSFDTVWEYLKRVKGGFPLDYVTGQASAAFSNTFRGWVENVTSRDSFKAFFPSDPTLTKRSCASGRRVSPAYFQRSEVLKGYVFQKQNFGDASKLFWPVDEIFNGLGLIDRDTADRMCIMAYGQCPEDKNSWECPCTEPMGTADSTFTNPADSPLYLAKRNLTNTGGAVVQLYSSFLDSKYQQQRGIPLFRYWTLDVLLYGDDQQQIIKDPGTMVDIQAGTDYTSSPCDGRAIPKVSMDDPRYRDTWTCAEDATKTAQRFEQGFPGGKLALDALRKKASLVTIGMGTGNSAISGSYGIKGGYKYDLYNEELKPWQDHGTKAAYLQADETRTAVPNLGVMLWDIANHVPTSHIVLSGRHEMVNRHPSAVLRVKDTFARWGFQEYDLEPGQATEFKSYYKPYYVPGFIHMASSCGFQPAVEYKKEDCNPLIGPMFKDCYDDAGNPMAAPDAQLTNTPFSVPEVEQRALCIHDHTCTLYLAGSQLQNAWVPSPVYFPRKFRSNYNRHRHGDRYEFEVKMKDEKPAPGRFPGILPIRELWKVHAFPENPSVFTLPVGVYLKAWTDEKKTNLDISWEERVQQVDPISIGDVHPGVGLWEDQYGYPYPELGVWGMCPSGQSDALYDYSGLSDRVQKLEEDLLCPGLSHVWGVHEARRCKWLLMIQPLNFNTLVDNVHSCGVMLNVMDQSTPMYNEQMLKECSFGYVPYQLTVRYAMRNVLGPSVTPTTCNASDTDISECVVRGFRSYTLGLKAGMFFIHRVCCLFRIKSHYHPSIFTV